MSVISSLKGRFVNGEDEQDQLRSARSGHVSQASPASMKFEKDAVRSGEKWMQTLWMSGCPPNPSIRLLRELTSHSSVNVELTIRVDPVPSDEIQTQVDRELNQKQTSLTIAKRRGHPSKVNRLEADVGRLNSVQSAIEDDGEEVVRTGVFATVRHNSKEDCESAAKKIRNKMRERRVTMRTVHWQPQERLRTSAPTPGNYLGRGYQVAMTGSTLGTMFPFTSDTLLEEDGIIYGWNASTNEPVKYNRYAGNSGYDMVVIGDKGSGKSYGVSGLDIREWIRNPNMISIVVDPRNAFGDLCNAFDGDRIVVGGDTRFNPLEITETPQRLTDEVEDLNPYSDKRRSFIGFAQTFFSESESEKGLSTLELNILREAFDETMARAGIYPTQLTTHSKPSPTIPDLKAVLWEIEQDVEGFLDREETDRTIENWEQAANRIRSAFEPFRPPVPCNEHKPAPIDDRNPDPEEYVEQGCSDCKMGGAYSNLALPSKFSIANSKFVYVDVQQTENDRTSPLMMKLVWDAIYNRVKESEHPVYTIIDEFHRILNNEGDLDWLENEYRHARHFDNAITVMSQSAADFFGHEKAERIVEMSANSLAFRTENMSDEHGEKLGFNSHEVYWINNCQAGDSDKGWANAILKAGDNDPIPLTVQALPVEERYIDRETWEYRHTDKQVEKPT